jgi:hypothetical protein
MRRSAIDALLAKAEGQQNYRRRLVGYTYSSNGTYQLHPFLHLRRVPGFRVSRTDHQSAANADRKVDGNRPVGPRTIFEVDDRGLI